MREMRSDAAYQLSELLLRQGGVRQRLVGSPGLAPCGCVADEFGEWCCQRATGRERISGDTGSITPGAAATATQSVPTAGIQRRSQSGADLRDTGLNVGFQDSRHARAEL
jgi:hypothetical protein